MFKKTLTIIMIAALGVATLAGCGSKESEAISVLTREEGSGTRGAFVELFGIEQKNEAGEKIDHTIDGAETTNSTSVMLTTVQGNKAAIGYVSLGSLQDTVKALKVDGVEATVDNIKDGSYKISRPFIVATKEDVSEATQDFLNFILSEEGQKVVEDKGYISQENKGAYVSNGSKGKVKIVGSSSVTAVMEKLKEAFANYNADIEIEIQQNDSSTGVKSVISGICDIGMASRELEDTEIAEGVAPTVIALDGIAVIVNKDNELSNITQESVRDIYMGEITEWSDVK